MQRHIYASQISSHSAQSCSENPQAAFATQMKFFLLLLFKSELSNKSTCPTIIVLCVRFNAERIYQNAAEDVNYKYKLGPAEKQNHT